MTTLLRRHRWIHVQPEARTTVARRCSDADEALVQACLAAGWPLVARSRNEGDPPGFQPAGLSLPLSRGRRRIALALLPNEIACVEEPAPLTAVASVLPPAARTLAHELAHVAERLGFTARVFGSAAWQWRTGERSLTETSDLDLLAPAQGPRIAAWLESLRERDTTAPMRLDGEIEDDAGNAVNWREWTARPARALVKSAEGARLVDRASLLASWP